MTISAFKDILGRADKDSYSVGAFNVSDIDTVIAVLNAAEEIKSPVIIQIWGGIFDTVSPLNLVPLTRKLIEDSGVPAALHLDHAKSIEEIRAVVDYGFNSVMIDASTLIFEENVRKTREVVEYAHKIGVNVEAELGHVAFTDVSAEESGGEAFLTRPEEAAKFVEQTGIDALAVAIGTVHGLYKSEPRLDFKRLEELKRTVKVPLVLHGGSNTPDISIKKSVELGINKVNVATDLNVAFFNRLKEIVCENELYPHFPAILMEPARQEITRVVKEKIRLFGSAEDGVNK